MPTRRSLASRSTLAIALTILSSCGAPEQAAPEPVAAAPGALEAQLRLGKAQSVIVALDTEAGDLAAAAVAPAGARDARGARVAASSGVYEVAKASVLSAVAADGAVVLHRYAALPALHLELRSEAALAALRARPEVTGVYPDVVNETSLAESLPLIGQPAAAAAGAVGAGTAVAILDTGLDYTRAAFGSCTAAGPGCKVKYVADFAPQDNALDANGHGTNVAGIVAGVAPGADLIGLDVFDGGGAYTSDILAAISWCVQNQATYNIVAINMSLGGGSSTGPCTDGFTAGIHAAKAAGIVVVVASGNNGYTNMISSPACNADAVSVGAVYDSNLGGLAFSMCTDATTAADKIACFSNSSPYLTLLAPGSSITAAGITMSGTSQATPHVAGAVAVVRAASPTLTPDQAVAQLRATGKPITDPRNGVVTPRIDLSGVAQGGCSPSLTGGGAVGGEGGSGTASLTVGSACAWTASAGAAWLRVSPASGTGSAGLVFTAAPNPGAARSAAVTVGGKSVTVTQAADQSPPNGSVTIEGSPAAVKSLAVTLDLTASDPNGVPSMCVSNASACAAWIPFAATKAWTLATGASGTRTVYVRFKDGAGNVSAALSRSVTYDVTPPAGGALTAVASAGRVVFTWSGFTDAGVGVGSYRLVRDLAAVPAAGCAGGTLVYSGTATGYTDAAVSNGVTYRYRLCAVDKLGNTAAGLTKDARPAPDYAAPVGTVAIRERPRVKSLAVNLDLAATDASAVTAMCVSNTTTCSAWVPFAQTKAWTLSAGASGTRTVRVWFRDEWNNASTAAVSASVVYDVAAPTGGSLTATPSARQVQLAWSGFSDALSGVASYKVVAAPKTAPASCAAGTVLYQGANRAFTHTGLTTGAVWGYRVCATDGMGNSSAGTVRTAKVP